MDCVGSSFFNMVKINNKSLNLCSLDAIWVQYGLLSGNLVKDLNLA